jgi:hypothetical protein
MFWDGMPDTTPLPASSGLEDSGQFPFAATRRVGRKQPGVERRDSPGQPHRSIRTPVGCQTHVPRRRKHTPEKPITNGTTR